MTQVYCDYTTVLDVRNEYQASTSTTDDALILSLIRSLSKNANSIGNRRYYPSVQTRRYDVPDGRLWANQTYNAYAYTHNNGGYSTRLMLDEDLLELTTLTNGDGAVITSAQYRLYPLNETPKHEIALLPSTGLQWLTSSGDAEGAIQVAGIWGYHDNYDGAWLSTGAVLTVAANASVTSLSVTTGLVRAGYLLKIDSEMLYVSAVTTGATDTLTVVRGVNGSTAASHLISAALSRWYQPDIDILLRTCVVAQLRLRDNPVGETINMNGVVFATPRDVNKYLDQQLDLLALSKVGIG